MNQVRWILLVCAAFVIAAGASGCVQVVQATDCRGSTALRCGEVVVDTNAMTTAPISLQGLPGLP